MVGQFRFSVLAVTKLYQQQLRKDKERVRVTCDGTNPTALLFEVFQDAQSAAKRQCLVLLVDGNADRNPPRYRVDDHRWCCSARCCPFHEPGSLDIP